MVLQRSPSTYIEKPYGKRMMCSYPSTDVRYMGEEAIWIFLSQKTYNTGELSPCLSPLQMLQSLQLIMKKRQAIFSVSGNIFKCLTWKKMHICLLRLVYERLAWNVTANYNAERKHVSIFWRSETKKPRSRSRLAFSGGCLKSRAAPFQCSFVMEGLANIPLWHLHESINQVGIWANLVEA